MAPVGRATRHEPDDQVIGAGHPGHRPDPLDVRLGKCVREVDVRGVPRRDPEVGVRLLDRDRGVGEQPLEQPDLDEHQRHGEGDAHHRDRKPGLVMEQNLPRQVHHHTPPPDRVVSSLISNRD